MPLHSRTDTSGNTKIEARSLLNLFSEALLIFDVESRQLLDFNKVALSLFRCRSRESLSEHIQHMLTSPDTNFAIQVKKAFATISKEKEINFEEQLPKGDNSILFCQVRIRPVYDGEKVLLSIIISDIGYRKHHEEVKSYQIKLEKLLYEISAKFISSASPDTDKHIAKSLEKIGKVVEANAVFIGLFKDSTRRVEISYIWPFERRTNFPKHDLIIELDAELFESECLCDRKSVHTATLADKPGNNADLYAFYHENQMHSYLTIGLVYQETCIGFFGLGTKDSGRSWTVDEQRMLQIISELFVSALQRKEAIRFLLEGERTYREIYNASTDAMLVVDYETGYLIDVNRSFTELFGYSYTEYAHVAFEKLWDFSDTVEYSANDLLTRSVKKRQFFTAKGIKSDGLFFWADTAIQFAELHGIKRALVVVRDVTEFIQAEEMLTQSKDWFQSIVQQLTDVVVVVDEQATIKYVTPSVTKTMGYLPEQIEHVTIFDYLSEPDRPHFASYLEEVKRLELPSIAEFQLRCADNKWLAMELVGRNLMQNEAVQGLVLTLRDISERKGFEQKIFETVIKTEEQERERFAKNLHDDLGPLLSSLKMYIGMLGQLQSDEKKEFVIHQLLEIIKEAIVTTKHVSNDLSPHVLNNYGLGSALKSFISKLPSTKKILLNDQLNDVRFTPSLEISVYRIAKELINNSLKHSQAKSIEIKVEEKDKHLYLYFADDGVGIDAKDMEKYMEKGMGLSNIISRAKTLNSTFKFNSSPGKGLTFEMSAPIT